MRWGKHKLLNCLVLENIFALFRSYGFITFENQEDADRIIKKEVSVEVSVHFISSSFY